MKTEFDEEFEHVMSKEKEMPLNVRKSLDRTYNTIQTQSKKKKNKFVWKQVTAAACALLIAGAVLTNEQVRASINDLFSFGDKGIERAITEGFAQENSSTATDQNVKVTLLQSFSDENKAGMSFSLEFEDPKVLENGVTDVTMDFRLKNGNGVYIEEFIPDTKPLKGNNTYNVSGIQLKNSILDAKTGKTQLDIIIESNKGTLPILQDAVVEIESINIFRDLEFAGLTKIDGKWNLEFFNQETGKPIPIIDYAMDDPSSIIQVISAKANPTSLNLKFSVDQVYEDETPFGFSMKVIDENGIVYESEGFNIDIRDNQTYISTNFPITSYDHFDKLKFIIDDIGEVELFKN
ncbi:DUF4179 domain-containing protein [Sporosarcina sp. D27]|uniref:DUF4179 domain-containing protein n=1 Tax=Sporosarcina sp. D27 TaxID=1382305 RepID=UPI00046EBA8C|nr:DUF4179 domain-containing protein [Sporosarcina sp. D27]